MSKIPTATLNKAIRAILKESYHKRRPFVETIDLQIGLKNYNLAKDKRFSGSIVLPFNPRPNLKVCVIGNHAHCEEAEKLGVPHTNLEALAGFKKKRKMIKKFHKPYASFLATDSVVKKTVRYLGSALIKAGKAPVAVKTGEDLAAKVSEVQSIVKFQLKRQMCLGVAVGNVKMTDEQIRKNIVLSINFLVSLLKKGWQNVKSLNIKSTQGAVHRIY
ncbi:putative multi-domain containing protein [Aduncisulcus paluster]|uniref:Multi-domain containing protein n=1 Tax=Aduncisulcus paluster TaxID=2918883 RepID=A0ABQ5JUD7_9EUKA|nr:putative multi-domain containing protein [Aduncisulcus paluster]|eukprot:gnl/Carplike_NY0171/23_a35_11290.p1 GENE.gnl/Carplike_NY0171/23_a35_11290~~gnl/Carplike_NY0171/23_a35_11290.p1  ORF type:complete len:230 (+),score=79.64 gnl/Carplike_NY0171/23_a35_11290:40-690(+)